jgi:hypothetical protein
MSGITVAILGQPRMTSRGTLLPISIDPKGRVGVAGMDNAFNDRFDTLREVLLDGFLAERPVKSTTRLAQE